MRVLVVAFSDSIHTARWINQFKGSAAEIVLFPCQDIGTTHPSLDYGKVRHSVYGKGLNANSAVKFEGFNVFSDFTGHGIRYIVRHAAPKYRVRQLASYIKKFKPDIIHSLEIQHSGYLVNEVRKQWRGSMQFPKWLVTNWGSDIYLFGQFKEHQLQIREVIEHCDFYSCECERDIILAKEFGLQGKAMPVFPNTGGVDLVEAESLRSSGKTSERRIIALKGYQHWAGRALVGLRALERCADLLKDYEVVLYSVVPKNAGVELAAELFTAKTGIPTRILPKDSSRRDILKLHGSARISIGLSISDGISTSFLESLIMGSFPIQSDSACANEWIECGKTGLLVPAEDPEVIEKNIRMALTNDALVDTAAKENWRTVQKRLDQVIVSQQAKEMYDVIHNSPQRS